MSGNEIDRKSDALFSRLTEVNKHFAAGMLESSPSGETLDDSVFLDSAVRAFLEALAPYGLSSLQRDAMLQAFLELLPTAADSEFDSTDQRIDELFAEIAQQRKRSESSPGSPDIEKALAELRELQEKQAARVYAAHVDTHLKPIEAAWKKIRDAERILKQHENPSSTD